jgi:hypothetical protein
VHDSAGRQVGNVAREDVHAVHAVIKSGAITDCIATSKTFAMYRTRACDGGRGRRYENTVLKARMTPAAH